MTDTVLPEGSTLVTPPLRLRPAELLVDPDAANRLAYLRADRQTRACGRHLARSGPSPWPAAEVLDALERLRQDVSEPSFRTHVAALAARLGEPRPADCAVPDLPPALQPLYVAVGFRPVPGRPSRVWALLAEGAAAARPLLASVQSPCGVACLEAVAESVRQTFRAEPAPRPRRKAVQRALEDLHSLLGESS